MFFPIQHFTPKLFCFFCIHFFFISLSANLLVEFSFVILESPFSFILLEPISAAFGVNLLTPIYFDLFFLVLLSDISVIVFLGHVHFIRFR